MTINQLITANLLKIKCSLLLLAPTEMRLRALFVTLGLKKKKKNAKNTKRESKIIIQ